MKKNLKYKKAFSIIELIFAIMIIGIIASVAIPKLLNLNSAATISSIKQDTNSIISSIQGYYIINKKIDKITDSINLNTNTWEIKDKEVQYLENQKSCITISISSNILSIKINPEVGNICKKLENQGIVSSKFTLN